MSVVIITGSAGLVGSEAARFFAQQGYTIIGIDNDMRSRFFGKEASTKATRELLSVELGERYIHHHVDIRDPSAMTDIFLPYRKDIAAVIHTAAQPSHDLAGAQPLLDFRINALGTLYTLEITRILAPDAVFIFTSTNKVYGDRPNHLPLIEMETRWEIEPSHLYVDGIPEDMPLDNCLHSIFGASKAAADIMVQEYGRYFGMKTGVFRGGCLTGPAHAGAELHGFLAYLMKCAVTDRKYTIFGYKGKQVRDNIHSADLVAAFWEFFKNPRPGEVYNIGGGRYSNCSVLEALVMCEEITGKGLNWEYLDRPRRGDHIWWISSNAKFREHYPGWHLTYDVPQILREIYEAQKDVV